MDIKGLRVVNYDNIKEEIKKRKKRGKEFRFNKGDIIFKKDKYNNHFFLHINEIDKYISFCKFQVSEIERKLLNTTPLTTTNEFVNLNEKIKIEVKQELRKYYNGCISRSSIYIK